jgi:uncharacterized Zn finger protein (UPF0148 family)
MHQYTCPKCKTLLRRQDPVPTGKKIKCPKCATIFAPAAVPVGKAKDDEVDQSPYKVVTDEEQEEHIQEEKQRAAMGLVEDRFEKSMRGPAQGRVTVPSNLLTAVGIFYGFLCILVFLYGLFPLVFQSYYLDTEHYNKLRKDAPEQLAAEWKTVQTTRAIYMVGAIFGFMYAGLICVGAFKMRTIESYSWAMTGSIMAALTIAFPIGIWCIVTLRDPTVIEGFEEEPPPEHA